MVVHAGEVGGLAAAERAQLRVGVDGGLDDAEQQPVSVRDGLRVRRPPLPLLGVVRVPLALLLGAYPIGDVVLVQGADRRRVRGAVRVRVPECGEVDADLAVVVLAGAVVDAREPVHVASREVGEGDVVRVGVGLDEAAALDPAMWPLLAVRVHELPEVLGARLVAEGLGLPAAAASALEPPDLVDAAPVLAFTLPDGRLEGRVRATWSPR